MKEQKDSRRWLIWLEWMVVVGALILPLTATMGQRLDKDKEANHLLDKHSLRHRSTASPFHRFFVSPPLPNPSRSRQGNGWMQGIVWLQPILTGRSVAFSPDGKLLATTGRFGTVLMYRVPTEV